MTFEGLVPPTLFSTSGSNASLGSTAYTFPIYVPCESVEDYKTAFGEYYAPRITCAGPEPQSAATAITITVPQNIEPGDTGSTSVSTNPSGATTNLSYSSSDNSVATVDNNGNITAVGTGATNICVTDSISQITECAQLTVNNSLLGEGDVSATVLPRLSASAVPLCSSSNLGSVSKMAIDGVEITPVSAYTFGDTNLHTLDVWYLSSTIPYDAFEYADRLKDVVIKDRMTVIGGRAFYWCTGITSVHIGSGITTINNSAFQGDKSITSITIPDAVNTMGTQVFSGCTSIISATIGTGMTTIPDGMFNVCSALTQVTVNGNVAEIGAEAFNGCKSLTAYPFTNSLAVISQSAFKGCESLTSVVLPDSVVSAGTNAFEGCTGLTAVTLSTGLTEIANNMFSSCGTLQSVSLPDSITKIGGGSFEGCSAMTTVVFGSGITEIGDYAFQNCSYLRGIDIPETITKFGAYCFRFDTTLPVYGITIRNASVPQVGNQAFASTDDAPIYVPAGSVEAYKTSTTLNYYWATYANRIQAIQ
jgi:YD repeat-containing protein